MKRVVTMMALAALPLVGSVAFAASQEAQTTDQNNELKLGSNLTIKGDLRLRYERCESDLLEPSSDKTLDRYRTRLRAGGLWENDKENWEVGAGLITGSNDATSSNNTWSEENLFGDGGILLDYAYAKHTLNDAFSLTLGQQVNPYSDTWLFWDVDVRPAGLTASYEAQGPFVTAGAYDVYQAGDDVAMMYVGRVGYKGKVGPGAFTTAATYYNFDDKIFDLITRPNPDYEYKEGCLYADLSLPAGAVKLTGYGQLFTNFGAEGEVGEGVLGGSLDPESENTGWVLGLKGKLDKVALEYGYAQVGADSLVYSLKDQDFGTRLGNGVDIQGHLARAGYNFTKNFAFVLTGRFYEPMSRSVEEAKVEEVAYYQFDFNYKF